MVACGLPGAYAVLASSRRSFARHMHDQFGIGVLDHGAQLSHSGRGQVEAGPGDVITVNPGEVHDGTPIGDNGRGWRILYFDPAAIAQAGAEVRDGKGGQFEIARPVLHDRRASRLVRRLFAAATSPGSYLRTEELLLATIAAIGTDLRHADHRVFRPEIARARALIDDDPTAAITLADLAEVSGLSRFQLLRGFARATGLTPHAYIVQRRVEAARRLVAEGSSLADAAAGSGFADQSHMTRAFTSRFGWTPGALAALR